MTREELIPKRLAKLKEHMESKGVTSMTQLAKKVYPKKKDAKKCKQLERRLYACASPGKPQLLQLTHILDIAPILGIGKPSDIYIELTDAESKEVGGTEMTKAPPTQPEKKPKARAGNRRGTQRSVVLRTHDVLAAESSKRTDKKNGLPIPISCAVLGINFQDYLTFDPKSQTFQGQNCKVAKVDGVLHLLISAPIGKDGSAALLQLVTN